MDSALDTDIAAVLLKTASNPFRHQVFSGLDYGSNIGLRWTSPTQLEVRYRRTGSGRPHEETVWRTVTIRYLLE